MNNHQNPALMESNKISGIAVDKMAVKGKLIK